MVFNALEKDIEKLYDIQGKRHQGHQWHEEDEDAFLCGAREEAVHLTRQGSRLQV